MTSPKPVLVLIPGGFHRPSSWSRVAALLRDRGYTVQTPQLATSATLPDDAPGKPPSEAAQRLAQADMFTDGEAVLAGLLPVLEEGREAVLVSHSLGCVAALAAVQAQTVKERAERGLKGGVKAMVNVAGFAFPVAGRNLLGTEEEMPVMPYHILENGILYLQEAAKPLFYSDLPVAEQNAAWDELDLVMSRKQFTTYPDYTEADLSGKGIQRVYVSTENDQSVNPDYQQFYIHAGKFDKVVKIPSGHAPMLSMPEKLADIIAEVAEDASGRDA